MPGNLSMLWRYGPFGRTQTLPVLYIMFSYYVVAGLLVPQINEIAAIIWCPKPILWPSWTPFLRAAPEKFENDLFTLKRHQLLSVRSTPDKLLNQTITSYFGVWEKNSFREITWDHFNFSKSSVLEMFFVQMKTQPQGRRFDIPPVWKTFSKSSFLVTD